MAKSVRVIIGGKEYSLRGDDEKLIQQVANEVNTQLANLELSNKEESATTLSVLTALNIAEKYYKHCGEYNNYEKNIAIELNSMAEFLARQIQDNSLVELQDVNQV